MKIVFISMTLLTMLAFILCVSAGATFAMGANGGSFLPQGDSKAVEEGKKGEKNVDKRGEGAAGKEKAGKPSPKKSRLKYRDMYECGC